MIATLLAASIVLWLVLLAVVLVLLQRSTDDYEGKHRPRW